MRQPTPSTANAMKAHSCNISRTPAYPDFSRVHLLAKSTSLSYPYHLNHRDLHLLVALAIGGNLGASDHVASRSELKPRPTRTGRQQTQDDGPSQPQSPNSRSTVSSQRQPGQRVPTGSRRPRTQQQFPQQNAGTAAHNSTQGPTQRPPAPVRVLGVDYGPRWTGAALGDNGRREELQVLEVDPHARGMFARKLVDLALEHKVQGIIVGLPLDPYDPASSLTNPDSDSEQGKRCRNLAHALALVGRPHNLNVYLLDEANTSKDALRILGYSHVGREPGLQGAEKLDKKLDSLAASLLLQRYFDKPGRAVRVVVRDSRSSSDHDRSRIKQRGSSRSSSSDEEQVQQDTQTQ